MVFKNSFCIFHSWWVIFGNNQLTSWLFSLVPFLPPSILSSTLEPGWFILNVDQILSLPCSNTPGPFHHRIKSEGFTMVCRCHVCSGTRPSLWPHFLHCFCSLCFSSAGLVFLQVKFTPSLRPVLWLTRPELPLSQIPSLRSGHFLVTLFPYPTWFSFLTSTYHHPTTYIFASCLFVTRTEARTPPVCPLLHQSRDRFSGNICWMNEKWLS